ncbi:MAG: histidine--tRNA ligase, partial [Oscillospiraceae bacterium]|nr:histidine--tRNA ligase [Oscillospiraceae bacterium]
QVYFEKKKFKAKMSYADKSGIPYVIFLGEDEIKEGRVTVKDMRTGEQTSISPAMAATAIRAKLDAEGSAAPIKDK